MVHPAEALFFKPCSFWCRPEVRGVAVPVGLSYSVTASGKRNRFFVVHRHTRERFADLSGGLERIGLTVDAFRVDVDKTHLYGGERVLHRRRVVDVLVSAVARGKPFLLGSPVGVFFGVPHVGTAE
ncbi:unannotated protein [freshwater metagenome]|uniref:Unannotated protein n=1 Tax=freshwater metagenome TaxID=449393 RepID=A0A6J6G506_9ZZZZ